jgi:UDP-N-acetylmuramoyl-L-alanyl-D-glutamate--2,6-diaminopimelate ligase
MLWNSVIAKLPVLSYGGSGDPVVVDVSCDSRAVGPGSLYVSIPGFKQHGDTFIADAAARGAAAILSENPQPQCRVPWAQVPDLRKNLGLISRAVHNIDPSQTLFLGITGTSGKTTTAYLFKRLLSLIYGEEAVWMYGTVKYSTGNAETAAQRTTPESSDIFRTLGRSPKRPKAVVMEVSSHALALDRVAGIPFDFGLLTNLTHDHLDFHKTMEDYYQAKKRLFTDYAGPRRLAVINIDDPWGKKLVSELPGGKTVTYGKAAEAAVQLVEWKTSGDGTAIACRIGGAVERFSSKLAGNFNAYNMTALTAGAVALSFGMDEVRRCFETVTTVPGRMERIELGADFSVFVDYAHKPDAMESLCSTARGLTRNRLVCVFGCGGDRDVLKRPVMGEIVARHCDEAIVTSDNPRSEDPHAIIREILRGVPLDFPHTAIVDRKEAIRKAIAEARAGDCIIIAGKGHEDYQEIRGVKHHFDDREIVLDAYREARTLHG